jgi:pectate lyase-like protein
MINVRLHGAVGDGVHDDTAAFLEAIAEMAGDFWQPLYIPTGTYRLTQPLALASNGRVLGDGPGMSWLVWDSGDGLSFTSTADDQEFLDLSGLSFRTKGTSGTALKADFTAQVSGGMTVGRFPQRFSIHNCHFWPAEDASQGWAVAFDLVAGLHGLIEGCNAFGRVGGLVGPMPVPASGTVGFRFRGTAPNLIDNGHPVAFVVRDSWLSYHENSVVFEGCEGGFVGGCNLVGVANGIVWDGSGEQRPQLNVTASHISSSAVGIDCVDAADVQISSTLLYNFLPAGQPASIGIRLGGCITPSICQNTFAGILQPMNGIVVDDTAYGSITGNLFRNLVTTGITLGAGASHFRGSGNIFAPSTATPIADSGSDNFVT